MSYTQITCLVVLGLCPLLAPAFGWDLTLMLLGSTLTTYIVGVLLPLIWWQKQSEMERFRDGYIRPPDMLSVFMWLGYLHIVAIVNFSSEFIQALHGMSNPAVRIMLITLVSACISWSGVLSLMGLHLMRMKWVKIRREGGMRNAIDRLKLLLITSTMNFKKADNAARLRMHRKFACIVLVLSLAIFYGLVLTPLFNASLILNPAVLGICLLSGLLAVISAAYIDMLDTRDSDYRISTPE